MRNNFYKKIFTDQKGFVLLFSVVLVAIFLAISLGVSNITLKELHFSTSAKNTNDAFYASDAGVECALYYLFNTVPSFSGDNEAFGTPTDLVDTPCNGVNIALNEDEDGIETSTGPWMFNLTSLGAQGQACALIQVTIDTDGTEIISRGYNVGHIENSDDTPNCDSNNTNQVERVIEVRY